MMAKYSKFERKSAGSANYKIHPVWTGIGFLMIIIVPIISWAAASELVTFGQKQGWAIMRSFPTYLELPEILVSMIPGIGGLTRMMNLPAISIFFLIILLLLTGVLSLGYAFIYRLVGPPRYSPQDEPAPRVKTAKYKR
jgi:hypothetical protein